MKEQILTSPEDDQFAADLVWPNTYGGEKTIPDVYVIEKPPGT